jgi:uncharacterized protein with HEPN domain
MRNIVIHQYDGVDMAIVWKTVKKDFPDLKKKIVELKKVKK